MMNMMANFLEIYKKYLTGDYQNYSQVKRYRSRRHLKQKKSKKEEFWDCLRANPSTGFVVGSTRLGKLL